MVVQILWSSICKVLVTELRRIAHAAVPIRQEEVANVTGSLDHIMGAMATLSSTSPLVGTNTSILCL